MKIEDRKSKISTFATENDTSDWILIIDGYFESFRSKEEMEKILSLIDFSDGIEGTPFGSTNVLEPHFAPSYIEDYEPDHIDKISESIPIDIENYIKRNYEKMRGYRSEPLSKVELYKQKKAWGELFYTDKKGDKMKSTVDKIIDSYGKEEAVEPEKKPVQGKVTDAVDIKKMIKDLQGNFGKDDEKLYAVSFTINVYEYDQDDYDDEEEALDGLKRDYGIDLRKNNTEWSHDGFGNLDVSYSRLMTFNEVQDLLAGAEDNGNSAYLSDYGVTVWIYDADDYSNDVPIDFFDSKEKPKGKKVEDAGPDMSKQVEIMLGKYPVYIAPIDSTHFSMSNTKKVKDNEAQMAGVQMLKGLATSDDPLANKFMKALNKAMTEISKEVLGGKKDSQIQDARTLTEKGDKVIYFDFITASSMPWNDKEGADYNQIDDFLNKGVGERFDSILDLINYANKHFGASDHPREWTAFEDGRIISSEIVDGELVDYSIYLMMAKMYEPSVNEMARSFGIKTYDSKERPSGKKVVDGKREEVPSTIEDNKEKDMKGRILDREADAGTGDVRVLFESIRVITVPKDKDGELTYMEGEEEIYEGGPIQFDNIRQMLMHCAAKYGISSIDPTDWEAHSDGRIFLREEDEKRFDAFNYIEFSLIEIPDEEDMKKQFGMYSFVAYGGQGNMEKVMLDNLEKTRKNKIEDKEKDMGKPKRAQRRQVIKDSHEKRKLTRRSVTDKALDLGKKKEEGRVDLGKKRSMKDQHKDHRSRTPEQRKAIQDRKDFREKRKAADAKKIVDAKKIADMQKEKAPKHSSIASAFFRG